MKAAFLVGRVLFGAFFVYNGINHFKQRKMLGQYAAAKRVPQAEAAVVASGALIVFGGASVALGIKPRWGAAAIATFLGAVSPVIHDFWNAPEAGQHMNDFAHFGKNMALLGSAIAMMGIEEPWPLSVPVFQPSATERVRSFARRLAA